MPQIYKIMTLNINGIESDTKHRMLEELLKRQEIDIALYQEVTNNKINTIQGYHTYINIGSEKRGTAIAMKEGTHSSEIRRIPTGRGIAAKIEDTWILNIYAPSGTTRKAEREQFFNTEITYIMPTTHKRIILAGDFNCTMAPTDCTGTNNHSAALEKLIKGIGLTDAWNPTQTRRGYTHYTANGASRLDRIYATKKISKKTGIETMVAAFSDHNAVILRLKMDHQVNYRGKGYWKMNINMLQEKTFQETFKAKWEEWKMNKKTLSYKRDVVVTVREKADQNCIHGRRDRP
jgi:exonuclease III